MKRNRIIRSYIMIIDGTPNDVFPLLCPVREYDWIQPWQCEIVYTDSGIAELDCVFKTNFPDDGPEDTWVVSRYEPDKYIEFVRINSLRSIRYSIELNQQDNGSTQAKWEQVITGLNSEGDVFVAGLTDETFFERMETLQNMINHYLKTGEMLKIM
jgi:hypothetical protein